MNDSGRVTEDGNESLYRADSNPPTTNCSMKGKEFDMGTMFKGISQRKKVDQPPQLQLPSPELIQEDKVYEELERVYNNATILFNFIKASEGQPSDYPEIWKKRWTQSNNLLFTTDRENPKIVDCKVEATRKYILELAYLDLRNVWAFLIFVLNRLRSNVQKTGITNQMFKNTADQLARIKGADKWEVELTMMTNTSQISCELLASETGPDTDGFEVDKLTIEDPKASIWELIKQADNKLTKILEANSG